jgi:hypothetical protein
MRSRDNGVARRCQLAAGGAALVGTLTACTSSHLAPPTSGGSRGASSGSASTAVHLPAWAAGYWTGHQRTLDLAPNGDGLLVFSLTGGGAGPFATVLMHIVAATGNQATAHIDTSDDPKTAAGSTHVLTFDPASDVITMDIDGGPTFCGVTAVSGTCGA